MQPGDYYFLVQLAPELAKPPSKLVSSKSFEMNRKQTLHGVDFSCWMDESYAHAHQEVAQMSFVRVWLYRNVPFIHPTKKPRNIVCSLGINFFLGSFDTGIGFKDPPPQISVIKVI
jgi:hypothetical protein